jgi:hypothetical protein
VTCAETHQERPKIVREPTQDAYMFHLTSHSTSCLALKPMVVLCRVDCVCYQVLGHIGSNTFELSRVAKIDRLSTYSEEAASYKASSRHDGPSKFISSSLKLVVVGKLVVSENGNNSRAIQYSDSGLASRSRHSRHISTLTRSSMKVPLVSDRYLGKCPARPTILWSSSGPLQP